MAQLDPLLRVFLQHAADELLLVDGEQPSLVMGGASRPIVKSPLDGRQIQNLLEEITPAAERTALMAGLRTCFPYTIDGTDLRVEVDPGPRAVIRIDDGMTLAVPETRASRTSRVKFAGALTMENLFRTLVACGGSDLHISTGSVPLMRVDGDMCPLDGPPALAVGDLEALLVGIAPERNRDEFRAGGDTDFAFEVPGLCRFRCNLFRDRRGPGGVFRVIPSKILTVDDLGLSQEIRNLCMLTKGLVLVTGPTGSGKSTTLTALVDHINKTRSDHIITIEDPIEFVHDNQRCLVNQREVHLHTKGFKTALRAALREDPDVVLVGEMRDLETIAIAIETAETGHLVFGTLHTSSAVSTVDRLIDQYPADQQAQIRVMLSESLKAVIAQVLCRKIGGGRCAALEVLMVTAAVSNLIREGKTFQIPSLMQAGKQYGMVPMNDSLLNLVTKKLVDPAEAYVKSIDKQALVGAFKSRKISTSFLGPEAS